MESYNFFELNYENIADFIQTEFKVLYACWDEEISDNGKKHIHLYMELDHKVRFSTIQKKLTGAHIDRRYGSPTEARQYIEKPLGMLFKGKEKSHTVVKPMQELGSEQKRYREFVNSDSVVKHTNAQGKTSISVNREVYYLYGPAGCGKTEGVKRKYGDDEVSQITNLKYDMKFDDYKNNSVLLFDEFYSQLSIQQMLNLLDNKITKLPCRYENKYN